MSPDIPLTPSDPADEFHEWLPVTSHGEDGTVWTERMRVSRGWLWCIFRYPAGSPDAAPLQVWPLGFVPDTPGATVAGNRGGEGGNGEGQGSAGTG